MFELDTLSSEFKEHPPMQNGRWLHRATAYKNQLFVSGGVDNDKEIPTNKVNISNYVNNSLKSLI